MILSFSRHPDLQTLLLGVENEMYRKGCPLDTIDGMWKLTFDIELTFLSVWSHREKSVAALLGFFKIYDIGKESTCFDNTRPRHVFILYQFSLQVVDGARTKYVMHYKKCSMGLSETSWSDRSSKKIAGSLTLLSAYIEFEWHLTVGESCLKLLTFLSAGDRRIRYD